MKLNLDRNFVSDIDRFLVDFDNRYPQHSASQAQEIEQYQVLTAKRDTKTDNHHE
jgi:hypothetical protein